MSAPSILKSLVKATPHVSILVLSLLWTYLTLGTKVRKTRRAFERQMLAAGMSREDAQRLSSCYQDLKDDLTSAVKQVFTVRFASEEPT